MERRRFLAVMAAIAPVAADPNLVSVKAMAAQAAAVESGSPGEIPYRPLGRTGERVSILGVGGYHIGNPPDEPVAIRIIRSAIDAGINFLDNCWDYHQGGSEIRMGKALRDGYRNRVFLMTKIDGRTKQSAEHQIDESLRRLQTDHVDLMQFHEIIRIEDPDRIFADDGAIHAMLAARKAGKIRFIGFTGHKDPFIHLRTLDLAREHQFRFDAVQMPLNVLDAHFRSFARNVLPVLVKEQMGVLGMKSMASGAIIKNKIASAAECLRYAMSLPVSTVISGMDSMELLQANLRIAQGFTPLSPEEITQLLRQTSQAAADGRYEGFKVDRPFDSTAHNPQWLG